MQIYMSIDLTGATAVFVECQRYLDADAVWLVWSVLPRETHIPGRTKLWQHSRTVILNIFISTGHFCD